MAKVSNRVIRTPVVLTAENFPVDPAPGARAFSAYRHRRMLVVLTFVVFAAVAAVVGPRLPGGGPMRAVPQAPVSVGPFSVGPASAGPASVGPASAGPASAGMISARPSPSPRVTMVRAGPTAGSSGRFAYAGGYGRVLGGTGPIRAFKVAVEQPTLPGAPAAFAAEIDRVLGDHRSWTAGRRFRLRRVPPAARAEFTVFLASARTSQRMCRTGGLETGGYTSCRLPRQVIINDARWAGAVRRYGAPLATYRAYAINHEVGHQLGHGHASCPGKGRPAPVMMQQTYGLKGCVANPWPYVGGRRYDGPPAP
jgi:uncharacterized protein DUF3152